MEFGNVASNQIYNPQNKKPAVPVDADEADSAMERFIRSKYVQSGTTNGAKQPRSGSIQSDEGTPPPLPPKTGGRFSFKSGSSTFPLSFRSKRETRSRDGPTSPTGFSDNNGPNQLRSKSSKVFGASVHNDSTEAMAQKLTQLREMGFVDDKRNAMVLKGVNGNLEKTIEALVRLGEGGGSTTPAVPSRESSLPVSRSLTPQHTSATTIGLSRASPTASRSPTTPSNNPWDISPAPPQSSQSTGTMQNNNPFFSTNPFGRPSTQGEIGLNQSLQNLSLAPSPQPQQQSLFPHHTGGLPSAQPQSHQFFQQSMTPPVPQTPQFTSAIYGNGQTYSPPTMSQPQQTQQSYNPFLQAPASAPASQPLSVNTLQLQSQNPFGGNPYTRSPSTIASPSLNQIPEQTQQNIYHSPQAVYGNNPFFTNAQAAQPTPVQPVYYQPQQQQQQQPQQFQQQQFAQAVPQQLYQPQKPDKAAIMALYNMPSTTPVPQAYAQGQNTGAVGGQVSMVQSPPQSPPRGPDPSQRSVSVPLPAGNKNPFMNGLASAGPASAFAGGANPSAGASSSRSRDSMALGMEMAWNNGRHSPDAFASLSARGG
ncbi:Protein gts1 [Diatrype stigma]|uniref:Protein gts1 n=1 Tax=Diatrype stigma TaxID=117547 RepID=A0AAN9YVF9_9PEZI